MYALLLVASLAAQASLKIAVMPLTVDAGIESATGAALTQVIVGEVRKRPGVDVVTQEELGQVLSLEQQKQLLGCSTDKCRVDVGNVLGVDRMLLGNLSKLGESWLFHLKLLDMRKVVTISQVDRRQRGGTVDDLLDAIPPMVVQLLSKDATPGGQTTVASTVLAPVVGNAGPNVVDTPVERASVPKVLRVATDGKGRYVAWSTEGDRALFSGDGKVFHQQRVRGYSASPGEFSFGFWEPRVRDPWMSTFGVKDGAPYLYCGEARVPWTLVPDKDAKDMMDRATVHAPRWRRLPVVLARDDNAVHYLVDRTREGKDADYRLYVGPRGKMVPVQVHDALPEGNELLVITPTGKLKADFEKGAAEWIDGQVRTPLKYLSPDVNHVMIYQDLSPYRGESLGTPCDGKL